MEVQIKNGKANVKNGKIVLAASNSPCCCQSVPCECTYTLYSTGKSLQGPNPVDTSSGDPLPQTPRNYCWYDNKWKFNDRQAIVTPQAIAPFHPVYGTWNGHGSEAYSPFQYSYQFTLPTTLPTGFSLGALIRMVPFPCESVWINGTQLNNSTCFNPAIPAFAVTYIYQGVMTITAADGLTGGTNEIVFKFRAAVNGSDIINGLAVMWNKCTVGYGASTESAYRGGTVVTGICERTVTVSGTSIDDTFYLSIFCDYDIFNNTYYWVPRDGTSRALYGQKVLIGYGTSNLCYTCDILLDTYGNKVMSLTSPTSTLTLYGMNGTDETNMSWYRYSGGQFYLVNVVVS